MAKIIDRLRLKNMSIKQSFIFLHSLSLIVILAAIVLEFEWVERMRQHYAAHPNVNDWVLSSQIILILLTVGIGIMVTGSLFYQLKIKKPLNLLMSAAEKIKANDLDFHLCHDNEDELGQLCQVFEQMRSQLETNFKELWRSVEERKQINAIFAHDLRTPLAVLKGSAEFLTSYVPQDRLSKDKILEMIKTMEVHIIRLESYTLAMNSIHRLEDMPVHQSKLEIDHLISVLNESAQHIASQNGKTLHVSRSVDGTKLFADIHLVMQVFENIVENGVRHASSQLTIFYRFDSGTFSITVLDDGPGFSHEALQKAVLPFYRTGKSAGHVHQGLGLYICKVLCEKHQGSLYIENHRNGGGQVTAHFLSPS